MDTEVQKRTENLQTKCPAVSFESKHYKPKTAKVTSKEEDNTRQVTGRQNQKLRLTYFGCVLLGKPSAEGSYAGKSYQ